MINDKIKRIINEVFVDVARPEVISIINLSEDTLIDELEDLYESNKHNICCLHMDLMKMRLVELGSMSQHDNDHFGHMPYG